MKRMKGSFLKIMIIGFITCLLSMSCGLACRYTVREIGFSDIGSEPYLVYLFTKSDTPEDDRAIIQKLSYALFYDANVQLRIVNVDEEKDPKVLQYLEKNSIQAFPAALFVTPQDETMVCSLDYPGRSFEESAYLMLEGMVSSEIRTSLIDQLLKSYCVVLVVHGKNARDNTKAMQEAQLAVREISGSLNQLPKVVNLPPGILIIPQDKINDEKILLTSLGITEKEIVEPIVGVIYGRGRIMGPLLRGDQITKGRIFNLLTVVGADCECGLDNSWLLGKMIPLRWDGPIQAEINQMLDFDVENPFVKAEMSQILSIKPRADDPINPLDNNLLGYSEGKFETAVNALDESKISASDIQKSFSETSSLGSHPIFKPVLMGFFGLIIMVLIIGVFLYVRNKQKNVIR
jgi:hypothetical protein